MLVSLGTKREGFFSKAEISYMYHGIRARINEIDNTDYISKGRIAKEREALIKLENKLESLLK